MHGQLTRRNKFPFIGTTLEYRLEHRLSQTAISQLVDALLTNLIPAGEKLADLKGRDPSSERSNLFSSERSPLQDEIFYLRASIPGATDSQEIEVSFLTKFDSFIANNSIQHHASRRDNKEITKDISFKQLGKVFPFAPQYFRFGLEIFRPKTISGLFGFSPSVTDMLYIEANTHIFEMQIRAEVIRRRAPYPLQHNNLFAQLRNVIMSIFEIDLYEEFADQVIES